MKKIFSTCILGLQQIKNQFYIMFNRLYLWAYDIKFGIGVKITGPLRLIVKGKPSNIIIGNYFICSGSLELYNRENGRILIADNVVFDGDIAVCAAHEATVRFEEGVRISPHFTCNAGADVTIGRKTLIARCVMVNSSEHRIAKGMDIQEQGFVHSPITIKNDVWLGANVCVNKGVIIGEGAVIGANAVVTNDIEPNAIAVGIPARTIKYRE
jgi:acetyltransferase-like isoleucine patch superfamily enzyme